MRIYHKETRIERHRTQVSWAATIPLLMTLAGVIMYFLNPSVPKWIDGILVWTGFTFGVLFLGLAHTRVAIAPFLYKFRTRHDFLYVIVDHREMWTKEMHQPVTWQRVLRILPGVYLLLGDTFTVPASEMERSTDIFHSSIEEVDDEIELDD